MTLLELRAMLARVNARELREDAGISAATVAEALGVRRAHVYAWETGRWMPVSAAGFRWARFVCGLEQHAEVTAEGWRDEAA